MARAGEESALDALAEVDAVQRVVRALVHGSPYRLSALALLISSLGVMEVEGERGGSWRNLEERSPELLGAGLAAKPCSAPGERRLLLFVVPLRLARISRFLGAVTQRIQAVAVQSGRGGGMSYEEPTIEE